MKIIILGAGQVGASLAENLADESNDITIIDTNQARLRELRDRLDIGVVNGEGSHPDILIQAGVEDADMLVAVTNNDEINMIACQVAHSLFRTPTKIARVRATAYLTNNKLFANDSIPIDVLISPEQLVSDYIHRLIETPGALQVLDFAEGKVQLVAVKAYHGGPLVGQELRFLREHMPSVDTRVAAIYRRGRAIMPTGSSVIEADDEVFFIAGKNDIRAVISELRRMETSYKRIIIAGGGNIGMRLARKLENRYSVRVVEQNKERAAHLSEHLERAIVLQGSASDQDLLADENIEDTDVFLALTNDDEANIMSSMLAKRLGARKVMALINNPAYVDLVQGGDIDIAISPQTTTIGSLLTHVRRGDMVSVHSLRRGAAEAIELIAHGDKSSSKVVGRALEDIDLPQGANIGAIVREKGSGSEVIIAHDNVVVESGDHVIVFLLNKKHTRDIEKLFQVGFTFF
ncbi:Trk system potassium transporter TrkA [Gilvimarinus agarilyticus]|uniref:Trk system potassium transporter TrkA n=1 Tax=unclassified Gilvimarinus TaxID=2642066 RepID=UPI001C0A309E|nr:MULTISPECIES: Trk system potassium transporter TrkA [unclassified Gilvimarinus]MBU2884240.1 Trk system potassium transporter TrkA [Gilvimarinus agarilyticus]MDO6569379.1 Trk system potassium transporter TrkA [Gilvimarinus sp. 2_MG-2023]MDO6747533.1 Trk system potassium transporter TrkA [Gilvimarinus sp. 1_MG-2023]